MELVTVTYKVVNKDSTLWKEHREVAEAWATRPTVTEEQQKELDNFKL